MPELGGPTTQSGILYQNTIAASYLGRLCATTVNPKDKQVVEVRCEAMTEVDDIVVLFDDGHQQFIQAKEAVTPGSDAWKRLWHDFGRQYLDARFRCDKDKITIYLGEWSDESRWLRAMAERAEGSESAGEWQKRMTQNHKRLYEPIAAELESVGLSSEHHRLFGRLCVHIEPREDIELSNYRNLPPCNVPPATLLRLLRDHAAERARVRKTFRAVELRASLQSEHNIVFSSLGPQPKPLLPQNRSRPQWFISSRLKDGCLRAEREAVIEQIEKTGLIAPWSCESNIPAGDYPYEEVCLEAAAASDGLLLILDGEITPLCLREYEAATKAHKPCFIFIKNDSTLGVFAGKFIAEQQSKGEYAVRFRNTEELKARLLFSLQSECSRAFERAQESRLLTQTPFGGPL